MSTTFYLLFLVFVCLVVISACSTDSVLNPVPNDYMGRGRQVIKQGDVQHNAFATLSLLTTGDHLTITGKTTMPEQYINGATLTVYLNKEYLTTLPFSTPGTESFRVDLPGGGTQTVQIMEGTQVRADETGPVRGTVVTAIATPSGYLTSVQKPAKAQEGIVAFTDSRGLGGGYVEGARYAWPLQVGRLRQADVYLNGYCSLQLGEHIGTATGRATLTANIVSQLQGHVRSIVYVQAGLNDYAYSTHTPAQLTQFLKAWLTELRQALPATRVFVETDGLKADESRNTIGYTLRQYREAEEAGAHGLATVVHGSDMWTLADLQDGTHLSITGDNQRVPKVQAVLGQ